MAATSIMLCALGADEWPERELSFPAELVANAGGMTGAVSIFLFLHLSLA